MLTPYDWQEGIGNRAHYIEAKLAHGAPVLAISLEAGILVVTYRRQTPKTYEIYDHLLFSAIGQQSDIETMRMAALEFASREGYNRSDEDVTIQRVVTALSAPLKKAFGDFGSAPLIVRSLFAEVCEKPENDQFFVMDYDGDYVLSRGFAVVAGTEFTAGKLRAAMEGLKSTAAPPDAMKAMSEIWSTVRGEDESLPESDGSDLVLEAAFMDRGSSRENRFRFLTKGE